MGVGVEERAADEDIALVRSIDKVEAFQIRFESTIIEHTGSIAEQR